MNHNYRDELVYTESMSPFSELERTGDSNNFSNKHQLNKNLTSPFGV
jgi:hypothetical protein